MVRLSNASTGITSETTRNGGPEFHGVAINQQTSGIVPTNPGASSLVLGRRVTRRNDCTIGEIVGTLKQSFGEHRDSGF